MLSREQLKTVRKIQIRTSRLVTRPLRGRVPERLQGPRHGVRRGAPVPARRRRPHHRLERHRAHRRAVRQALRRGARAHRDAAGRRQRLARTSAASGRSRASWPPSWARCSRSRRSRTTTRSGWSSSPTASRWRCRRARARATCCASSARSSRCEPAGRGTDIAAALEHLERVTQAARGRLRGLRLPRPALPPGRSCSASRRHDVIAVVLDDPREATLPGRRPGRARGSGDGRRATSSTRATARVREAFAARAATARTERDRMLRACDVDAIGVTHRSALRRGAAALLPHAGAPAVSRAARWLLLAVALAAGHVAAADEPAAPVTVHARVEPDRPTIGQRFRYVIEVAAQPGVEVVVTQPADHLGDFDIVDFGVDPPVQRDGATVVSRWWRLVGWSPGEHIDRVPGRALSSARRRSSATPRRTRGRSSSRACSATPTTAPTSATSRGRRRCRATAARGTSPAARWRR